MFLVVDNTRRKMRNEIYRRFCEARLPCIVSDLEHCDYYMPAALIIVTERYLLEPVQYLAKMYNKSPVVLWDEKTDLYKFILDEYYKLYGVEIFNSFRNRIKTENELVYFSNKRMWFTETEQRIFNFLFYYPGYHLKDEISKYCLKDGIKDLNAVPVHICNINNKAQRINERHMILSLRYKGYYI